MKVVSLEKKIERGWYYIGKCKLFYRDCNHCGKHYEGQGINFCSYRCSRLASPIRLIGDKNPMKNKDTALKVSNSKKNIPPHPNCIQASIKSLIGKFGSEARAWKGGGQSLHTKYSGRTEWSIWRAYIFNRDGYKCLDCGSNKKIEPHHIIPLRINELLVFDINNGVTLCRKCHEKTFGKELELVSMYKSLIPNLN